MRSECRGVHETLQARVEPTCIPEVAKAWAHIDIPRRQERVLRVRPCKPEALHRLVREREFRELSSNVALSARISE